MQKYTESYIFATIMKTKLSKAEKTRQYIIEKSAPVFNKKGYAGTTYVDLEEATGLTKGSIYGNFKDKDEVALAAFDYNFQQLSKGITEKQNLKESVIEKLLVYPKFYLEFFPDLVKNGGCAILNTASEADDTHPLLKEKVVKAIYSWKNHIVKLIDEGRLNGEIKREISPEKYADLLMVFVEGAILLTKTTGNLSFLFNSLNYIENLILNELKA